ncbi:1-aminocyclopropane-1-carboxylate deaminase/D-cysteine desulfhydrase [Chondromyces crocatus]|uniref:1-aminocyclopropane-1-carboxylate deaminase n=1 Tax=Chondromyces crocatus TaxID=52 RepID=A0A0K1EC91_CHOCO|nr:D-cysteine desulfhydrase family protein [Chondromyces crocatus]AKT38501.1 1-aminocyclopropane-1-carboxylate deaminase [Chondromyces crocatus]
MAGRIGLAHLPTPLQRSPRLAEALGVDLYIKRDDMTGGAEAGNKIRKLEFLLAAALSEGADTLITCGGIQSNHARATALLGASLGLRSVLVLRAADPAAGAPLAGNVLLDRMAGAEIRLITMEQYQERAAILVAVAEEIRAAGGKPYIIPEGGSNGLGALGYVRAMEEVRRQLDLGLAGGKPFDVIVHACGSGGTAAGLALGASRYEIAPEVRTMIVCNDAPTFERTITGIIDEARALEPSLGAPAALRVDERSRGPAYAVASPEQRCRIVEAARLGGLVLDPVYTGKAFAGLWDMAQQGELTGKRVLFLHTGGLPGLLVQADSFSDALTAASVG